MNITADTLFHFSNTRKNLESILEKRFHPTYCKETLVYGSKKMTTNYIPMISFCDIPLSLSKHHLKAYGNYAIGLKKEWGFKNKLNPVIHVEKDSQFSLDFDLSIQKIGSSQSSLKEVMSKIKSKEIPNSKELVELMDNTLRSSDFNFDLVKYLKNYEGDLVRKNKTINNYRFYNEREWRYVPERTNKNVNFTMTEKEFEDYRNKSDSKPLISEIKLDFNASDIKFIIVKSEKDVPRLIRKISSLTSFAKNADEIDFVTTKIITAEQLKEDY